MALPLDPGENGIGERKIAEIALELINEDAGVESDAAVSPQKRAQAF